MGWTNRITSYSDMREANREPLRAAAGFAPLPQFALASGQQTSSAALSIYQLAQAQAREQVEQRRAVREVSRWN